MEYKAIHHFDNLTRQEMKEIQIQLAQNCTAAPLNKEPNIVSAVDISYINKGKTALVVIVTFDFNSKKEIDMIYDFVDITVPYQSGYLAFRELPPFLYLWEKLTIEPDLVFFDGHGRIHFRRMGIACHASCFINKPTIGIGKTPLTGIYTEPENVKGAWSYIYDKDEILGIALKTKANCKPVYVSVGSGVSLDQALNWTLHFTDKYRIPQVTRIADLYTKQLKPFK